MSDYQICWLALPCCLASTTPDLFDRIFRALFNWVRKFLRIRHFNVVPNYSKGSPYKMISRKIQLLSMFFICSLNISIQKYAKQSHVGGGSIMNRVAYDLAKGWSRNDNSWNDTENDLDWWAKRKKNESNIFSKCWNLKKHELGKH